MFNLYRCFNNIPFFIFAALLTALLPSPFSATLSAQPCACTNCPQFMQDNFVGNFDISVQGATNPTLGQNGQGVCGVTMSFDHEYLGDLSITLTSPSGQSVQLVGPIGFFGPTLGTTWNVTFLPCGDPAVAPDPGFNAVWSNNQPWNMGPGTVYSGSYYPFSGCLQSFSGPVNGTWTLTVIDGQPVDVGNFYNYEIIFCDPAGINCFSCAADAGELPQPNVAACEGSASLNLNLPPTYSPPTSIAPPAADYSYTYVISGAGGVIQGYEPGADLTSYPVGVYNVCGLSYLSAQETSIPAPNGALTTAQLNTQLSSGQPPFCGDLTTNCVQVTVNPSPANIEDFETICAPDCILYYGQNYCQTGTYVRNLNQNGCPYTATLHLTVITVPPTNLIEVICAGECSQILGFETACTQGMYGEMFENYLGCDSLVTLNLTVLSAVANVVAPPELACNQSSLALQGTGSSTGGGLTYTWMASNGGTIVGPTNTINTSVSTAGDYQLKVCKIGGGVICCDSASVTVIQNQNPPVAPAAINGNNQICAGQMLNLSATPVSGNGTYTWTVPPGVTINAGQGTTVVNLTWNSPNGGNVCVTYTNACGVSPPTCLTITANAPAVPTQPTGPTLVCSGTSENYTTTLNPNATNYTWTVTAPATIAGGQGTNSVVINWGNSATASVCVNAASACGTSQPVCLPVQINAPPASPTVTGSNTGCSGGVGNYTIAPINGATSYNWQVTGGTITGGNGTTTAQITWNVSANSGSVCASAVNACGASAANCLNVMLGAPPAQPNITGNNAVCAGTAGSYSITPINGVSGYTWTVPTGGTIVTGQNSPSLNVLWTSTAGGNVCVSANSACGSGPQDCFPVIVTPQPVANAGAGGSVCGTSFILQATPSVAGSSGVWITVPGPGTATFANANSASTTVTVNPAGTYMFIWQEQIQTCTSNDSVTVIFRTPPVAGQISHDCDGTNQNYTVVFPITGGAAPYTVPGGSVVNGVFTSTPITSGQAYSFQVTDANGCTSATLTGDFNCLCATSAGMMSLQPLSSCEGGSLTAQHLGGQNLDANDVGAYVLHTNSGPTLGTAFAQNATGVFTFQSGMAYATTYYVSFVVGNTLNGVPDPNDPCFSVTQGQPVIWHQNPVANAGPNTDTCGLTISLNGNAGTGTGTWTVVGNPAGLTLTFGDPQSPVTTASASFFGTYLVAWTIDNLGCTDQDTVQLIFSGLPTTGPVATNCDANNQNYIVTFPLNGGTAPYTVNGVPVTGNTFISAPIASGTTYSFTINNASGCAAPAVTGSFLCNCSTQAGNMEIQTLSTCAGGSVMAIHLGGEALDGNDVTAYVLHTGNGNSLGTVLGQNATGVFNFQTGLSYGTMYYISFVVGNNLNGQPDPNDPCLAVAPGQPVTFFQNPVADAGFDADTCGLSLSLNGNSGPGQWTVSSAPNGAALIFADDQAAQSAVTASASGSYALSWTVQANGCVSVDQVELQFHASPSLIDVVRTCDAANENFIVTLTLTGGATPYTVNGSPVAGNSYSSQSFPNGQSYVFQISDVNGCAAPDVNGAYSCNCATNAGTMAAPPLTVCEDQAVTVTANNDQMLDGNDVTAYVLHDGSGPALGNVLDQNATGVFTFQSGIVFGKTYYVSLVAGNPLNGQPNPTDPCFSVAAGQAVLWLQNPAPDAGTDNAVCASIANLQAASSSFSGNWSQVSGPGTTAFSASTSNISDASASLSGSYIYRWTEVNGTCTGADEVMVDFNELPTVNALDEACDGTNTQFTVTFSVVGGTAPYSVTGLTGAFTANNFTSNGMANNTGYDFQVTDANGCTSGNISGAKNCNCGTDAGSIVTTPAMFCADQPATSVWNNDATLDANDLLQFILHSASGTTVGTVYATAAQPSFPFGGNLQPGVVYYISAVAGNNLNGTVDLTDDCLSVAPGAPVQWKLLPTAALTGDASICSGSSTALSFSGTGSFPLEVTYTGPNGFSGVLGLTGPQTVNLDVNPSSTATYTLTGVVDGTLPACSVSLNNQVTVQINPTVEAGAASAPLAFCAGLNQTVQLAQQLSMADAGGSWTEVSVTPSTGAAFNAATSSFNTAGQTAGTYIFRYYLDAATPCPDDEALVTVVIHPTPVADAGADKMLDCQTAAVTLGGPTTSAGAGLLYVWTVDTTVASTNIGWTTTTAGLYALLVTNSAGCTDQDQVLVTLDSSLPAGRMLVQGVRCFGDKNGSIRVDSILTSHPPLLFSLNGGPFVASPVFAPLAPGAYTLTLQDAKGCEWTSDLVTILEPPELMVNLGPDIDLSLGDMATVQLQVSIPLSALDTIIWHPLLDSTASGQPFQHWFPTESQQIGVQVVDSSGCLANDRVLLLVNRLRHVYIPNIIAPSASGNDVITVFGGRDVEEVEQFQIFDRWGEALYTLFNFQPNNVADGWSGKYRGQEVTPGVYAYYAVVRFKDGEKEVFSGDVTVLR